MTMNGFLAIPRSAFARSARAHTGTPPRNPRMTKEERFRYYASREWAVLKEAVKKRSGGKCERCLLFDHDQTHHLTYERFGTEKLEDLQGVCGPCHDFMSGKSDTDPATAIKSVKLRKIAGGWYVGCPVCRFSFHLLSGVTGNIVLDGDCGHLLTIETLNGKAFLHVRDRQ